MTAEDDRAAEFRRQQVARYRNKRALERALRGDPEAAAALRAATLPLVRGQAVPMIGEDR